MTCGVEVWDSGLPRPTAGRQEFGSDGGPLGQAFAETVGTFRPVVGSRYSLSTRQDPVPFVRHSPPLTQCDHFIAFYLSLCQPHEVHLIGLSSTVELPQIYLCRTAEKGRILPRSWDRPVPTTRLGSWKSVRRNRFVYPPRGSGGYLPGGEPVLVGDRTPTTGTR